MKQIPNDIYSKIEQLNLDVKKNLERRGLVVPISKEDGSIKLGNFLIKKLPTGFYNIIDYKNRPIVEGINLPHTAVIIANKLALGKWIDTDLLAIDKKYGHAAFDELVHKHSASSNRSKKQYDKADIMEIKAQTASRKKEYYKKTISADYRKLITFR
jgi:hypothetical protein